MITVAAACNSDAILAANLALSPLVAAGRSPADRIRRALCFGGL